MKPDQPRFADLLRHVVFQFREAGLDTPELDARLLLQHAAGLTHVSLISRSEEIVSPEIVERVDAFVKRRVKREPVHRILGYREFFGRDFLLSAETLVPRPDTEILVETVIKAFTDNGDDFRGLEIGTGSGCISITLACELAELTMIATDISDGALQTASRNAAANDVQDRVAFIRADIFEGVDGCFNFIVSNPPYIPSSTIYNLSKEVREHDPTAALDGGENGLNFYRAILQQAPEFLEDGGMVFLECGIDQADAIADLAQQAGFGEIRTIKDYNDVPRVLSGRLVGAPK